MIVVDLSIAEQMTHRLELVTDVGRACSLAVQECLGIRRNREPLCFGVPFPQAMVPDPSRLVLLNGSGEQVPLQTQVLSAWVDGSAKWVLVDFLADSEPFQRQEYSFMVLKEADPSTLKCSLAVQQSDDEINIETGSAWFRLCRNGLLHPLFYCGLPGARARESKGPSIVLIDDQGRACEPVLSYFQIESSGPIRVTVRLEGVFQKSNETLARLITRLSFFAGSGVVEMKCTLHNPRAAQHPGGLWDLGDEGSFYFQDLSMEIPVDWKAAEWNTAPLDPFTPCQGVNFELYQDSSGGRNWNSTNHCNRHGEIVPVFPGYQVNVNGQMVEGGKRAIPTVSVIDDGVRWDGTIEQFWQNFPKAIEVQPHGMKLRLFPKQCQDVFELQGGEQKTHTVYLQCSSTNQPHVPLTWVHERLVPSIPAEWYAQSGVVNYLTPRELDDHQEYLDLIDSAIAGENTFFDRREVIDEYGWRNFGDIYADHEAVGHTGPTPKISHYNNQYDVINGAIIEFFRSGDRRWYELMRDLARHVIDIDLYHTTEDRPEYNGGMFWHTDHYFDAGTASHRAFSKVNADPDNPSAYGGGPSNEQNYTTGLLHYYYLTGDPLAYEAVLSLADWVFRMDEGGRHWLRYLDPRPTGLASSTAGRDYHGPGRGAANSINALLDAYRLVSNRDYIEKAEALIRRCIHPHDVIEERNLGDVEYRWSYTVFLQILGKYLDFKIEHREIDTMYAYAQASLLHYAEWMLIHEVPYQEVMHKVKIPTETWPAQDIRKSNVFKFAAKHAEGELREAFLKKADYFFRACVGDLRSYATSHLTRPVVLLLVNGYMQASFAVDPEQRGVMLQDYPDFGSPKSFTPQLAEIYTFKELADGWLAKIRSWLSRNNP